MRHVTFGQSAAPFNAREKRLVPDDVAERLERDGMLTANEPWPPQDAAAVAPVPPAAQKPVRPVLTPKRAIGGHDRRAAK